MFCLSLYSHIFQWTSASLTCILQLNPRRKYYKGSLSLVSFCNAASVTAKGDSYSCEAVEKVLPLDKLKQSSGLKLL